MSLIPWKRTSLVPTARELMPLGSMRRLRTEMDRIFDRFFERPFWTGAEEPFVTLAAWAPMTDLSEDEKRITVRAELPGMDPKDIEVSLSGNILTIAGQKRETTEEKRENYYHCERQFGSFRRSIELPASADLEQLIARYEKGVLEIDVPKLASARGRQIPVKAIEEKPKKAPAMAGART
jgi:HSP20 family protein